MEDKIVFLNNVAEVSCAMGDGHFLQVKDVQRDGIHNFASSQINFQPKIEEVPAINPIPVAETVTVEPVIEEAPTMSQAEVTPMGSTPEVVEAPIMEEIVSAPQIQEPVMPEVTVTNDYIAVPENQEVIPSPEVEPQVQGVEIVSNPKEASEYDILMAELKAIDEECNQKIIDINKDREDRKNAVLASHKEKIEAEKAQVIEFKEQAEEHLKNAKAAQQIAEAAEKNATMIQQSVAMLETPVPVPTMEPVASFPESVPTSEIPSLDSAPVLTKVA